MKKAYSTPTLRVHGDVEKITQQTTSGTNFDFGNKAPLPIGVTTGGASVLGS